MTQERTRHGGQWSTLMTLWFYSEEEDTYEIVGLTKLDTVTTLEHVSVLNPCQVQHKEDVFAIHEGMEEPFPGKASYP